MFKTRTISEPVDVGTQLHYCDYVYVRLIIHLPQDNALQGLSGAFTGTIGVIQWNEYPVDDCGPILVDFVQTDA